MPTPAIFEKKVGDVEDALSLYRKLVDSDLDPITDVIFVTSSMQGEDFVNNPEAIAYFAQGISRWGVALTCHAFVPWAITPAELDEHLKEHVAEYRRTTVFVSPNMKYKEEASG